MRFVIIFIMLIVSFYTFGGKMAKSRDGNKWRSESTSTIYNLTDGQNSSLKTNRKMETRKHHFDYINIIASP